MPSTQLNCLQADRKIERIDTEINTVELQGDRKYLIGGYILPSVSSIIYHENNPFIYTDCWVKNIVEKKRRENSNFSLETDTTKAKKTVELPIKVGNYTHSAIEQYLIGKNKNLLNRSLGKFIKQELDSFGFVYGAELPVYSIEKGYAGTVDCIARLADGRNAIIDFKTSLRKKTKSSCYSYFEQLAAYAIAVEECYGLKIDTAQLFVIYRQTVGKKNPTRKDVIEIDDLDKRFADFDRKRVSYQKANAIEVEYEF